MTVHEDPDTARAACRAWLDHWAMADCDGMAVQLIEQTDPAVWTCLSEVFVAELGGEVGPEPAETFRVWAADWLPATELASWGHRGTISSGHAVTAWPLAGTALALATYTAGGQRRFTMFDADAIPQPPA